MTAFFILLLLIIGIISLDLFPQFYTWQSRIKIGRFQNNDDWKNKVVTISKKWLFKTPTIKLTDNSRLLIIDILKGNYKRNSIQHWQEAALLLGLTQEYEATKSETTKVIINSYIENKIDASGNWKNAPTEIDGVILAYAIINISWIDLQKYKPAFDSIYNLILSLQGSEGTIAYKKHSKNFRYVDTIGFICPFLVKYGVVFNNEKSIEIAVNQIFEFNKFGLLKDSFIPCHTYNIETKLPVGLFGWGRGLGWYAIGLIDAWKSLPENHISKNQLTTCVIQFAKMAMQFQDTNGGWHWIIMQKSSQYDSSTAATLSWFFANAASIPEIANDSNTAKEKALQYLQKVTRRNGTIDFSQGDTKGIGIHSQEFDILPFTQGFALRTLFFNS